METEKAKTKEKTIVKTRVKGQKEWEDTEIDTQPLSVIVAPPEIAVKPNDDFVTLDPETTVYHGARVDNIDLAAVEWIEWLLGYPLVDKEDRDTMDKHVIGLFDLSLKLTKQGRTKIFIKEPETYLHPKQERLLMTFFHAMNKGKHDKTGRFTIASPNKD